MYNRYIPQPDGSYRRSAVQDRQPPAPKPLPPKNEPEPEEPIVCAAPAANPPCAACPGCPSGHRPQPRPRKRPAEESHPTGVGNFLKNLLPGNFDSEDLLIVLLLLLMSGDCQEDRNLPLLTLALYLFL